MDQLSIFIYLFIHSGLSGFNKNIRNAITITPEDQELRKQRNAEQTKSPTPKQQLRVAQKRTEVILS